MDIDQFQSGLVEVIGQQSNLRPFICEGSPLDCEVFIVGYNPATAMNIDWWQYWEEGYGYRRGQWRQEYLLQREGRMSKTRKRIEAIVSDLTPYRVLEANIDARPSKRKSEYPRPVTAPFDYLLKSCNPKVIVAHGVDAVAHLESWAKTGSLIACKHFIYVGHERTAEIVKETRDAIRANDLGR
jgi:hypothetical protein